MMVFSLSSLRYRDSLIILSISIASTFVCESISWLLIYRTPTYKSLRSTINRTRKKLETLNPSAPSKKSKTKKKHRFKPKLEESSRDISFSNFKSEGVVAIMLIIIFDLLNSLFEGKVVAKLPFTLIYFIQKMIHRGLSGDDPTDCAMFFFLIYCAL
jgi:hypothetical protein